MRLAVLSFVFLSALPSVAFAAGSQTFNASGTFIVPSSYGSITVQVWGGGGGGVGLQVLGTSGGASIFGVWTALGGWPPTANGGARGVTFAGGAGGTAANGTTNTTGGAGALYTGAAGGSGGASPSGGAGGAGVASGLAGAGAAAGGGGGSSGTHPSAQPGGAGAGGYSSKTYSAGTFASGLSIPITVGAGGTGGISEGNLYRGGAGGAGRVVVTWTDPACTVTYGDHSATISAAGTCSFTIPIHNTLTAQVWGGGGAGGTYVNYGGAGGASSFNGTVVAGGAGAGGPSVDGAGGTASGGDINTNGAPGAYNSTTKVGTGGNSPNGGAGGSGAGADGGAPGGGGGSPARGGSGGGGAYASKTYSGGVLSAGASVTVVVGAGGIDVPVAGNDPGSGAVGRVIVTWTDATPTCSVTADVNPLGYGNSTTLRWTSTNATAMYINSVGYVTPNAAGSATVGPLATTNYDGTAVGGSTVNCAFTLAVNAPASCTFNGGSVAHGASVTGYQTATVPYGSSCTSQTRTCANGTLSGTYTFASCNVGPQCAVSVSPTSVTQENSSTLTWSSTNATSCTGDNFSTAGATAGSVSVSPSQSTTYTATCMGAGGSTQCTGTGAGGMGTVLTLSCTPAYSCTGAGSQTITYTDAACVVTNSSTCVLPQFCSAGSSSCIIAAVTGTISSSPRIVRPGKTAQITWTTSNASSCTVSGNGNVWPGTTGTQTSNVITEFTTYTLVCDDADADVVQDDFSGTVTLYRVPSWVEL